MSQRHTWGKRIFCGAHDRYVFAWYTCITQALESLVKRRWITVCTLPFLANTHVFYCFSCLKNYVDPERHGPVIRALFPFATISELDAGHWGMSLSFLALCFASMLVLLFWTSCIEEREKNRNVGKKIGCMCLFWFCLHLTRYQKSVCFPPVPSHTLQFMPKNQTTLLRALLSLSNYKFIIKINESVCV